MKKRSKPLPLVVRRAPGNGTNGIVQAGPLRLRCALGRSGTTVFKREGDGATPVASVRLLFAYRRPKRNAPIRFGLPTRVTRSDDGWCDAPAHAAYNRPVRRPFPASSEAMRRADRLYDHVVVLDWNFSTRARGRGSAIFLHVARPGFEPTEGCIALEPRDMMRLAPYLTKRSRLCIQR